MPIEVDGVMGGASDPGAAATLRDIRREAGWTYHLVLSRGCAHLFEEVSRLLQPWPHLRVVVDRRYTISGEATPPLYPELRKSLAVPPRPYHLVIRRDCAHLYEDLVPVFASRPDIRVLVDRRNRSRTPPATNLPSSQRPRQEEPPAWLV